MTLSPARPRRAARRSSPALVLAVHLRAAGAGGAQLVQHLAHLRLAAAGFTIEWWSAAWHVRGRPRRRSWVSVEVALVATAIALVLGTMAALALQRYRFFGRDTVSLLIILPIALPGIVTGIALTNAFLTMLGIQLGFFTLVVAHATFCIVTVFNNMHGAAAPARRQPRGGLDGPRRRHVHDVPAGHLPDAALGAAGRRPAGVRAELRRDHRDHVHRRPAASRPCRSGSSRTCSAPTRRRSSTWSPPR